MFFSDDIMRKDKCQFKYITTIELFPISQIKITITYRLTLISHIQITISVLYEL